MLRLALIGCGGMGNTHCAALRQLTGRAKLVAAVDLDLQRATKTARTLGGEHAVTD